MTFFKKTILPRLSSILIALCALWLVLSSLDAAGDYPSNGEGPGLTIDEVLNVQKGIRLEMGIEGVVVGSLETKDVFGQKEDFPAEHQPDLGYYSADYPPLGRLWIGFCHRLTVAISPPADHPSPFITSAARTSSAIAFAILVYLVASTTCRWYGQISGVIAGTSLILMPRLFGHAHIASLETITGLMFTATVLLIANRWKPGEVITWKNICGAGLLTGLTFLIKIQAILLPIPVACWVVWNWGVFRKRDLSNESMTTHWLRQVMLPLCCWGVVSFVIFFLLWPWLWLDPVEHLKQYFMQTTQRVTLYAWYFGTRYADKQVPWHYPWVMFLVTVPIGLLILGKIGLWCKTASWKEPKEQLLLCCILFPLVLFSLPGVVVYDGARLFLIVFPLWSIFIGKGGSAIIGWLVKKMSPKIAVPLFAVFLLLQGWGIYTMRPCYLSYYNALVSVSSPQNLMGMEKDYWSSSITRSLLQQVAQEVPAGTTIYVSPVAHSGQLTAMLAQSPLLRNQKYQLKPYQTGESVTGKYVLYFPRLADLPEELRQEQPPNSQILAETNRNGVSLARLLYYD